MAIETVPGPRVPAWTAHSARRAAIGATIALVGYVLLPTFRSVVILLLGGSTDSGYPRPADALHDQWWGVSGGVIFAMIGVGILLSALHAPSGPLTRTLGIVGGAGFLLCAGSVRIMWSWISANLTQTGADAGAQIAALWAVNVVNGGLLVAAACTTAGWMLLLGVTRMGAVGRGSGIVLAIGAAVVLLGMLGAAIPGVQAVFIVLFAVLTVGFWRRARRMRETSPDA